MILYQTDNSKGVSNNDIRLYHDFSYVPHFHRDIELIYMVNGNLNVTVEGETFVAKEGQMAIIFSNQIHSYESIEKNNVIVHVFSGDYVPVFVKLAEDKEVSSPVFDCDEDVKRFYLEYCIEKKQRAPLAMKAVLYAICNEFCEKSKFVPARKNHSEPIHQMLWYIAQRYKDEITLEQLAQELGYEKHYLSRLFSTAIKINIRRYINLYRVDHAKQCLLNTTDSIARIAMESGFQSIRNFNRVFTATTGVTPAEYRKQALESR